MARQQHTVLEEEPAVHGVAGEHVLGDRVLEEALGRQDLNLARTDIGRVHHAVDAAEVVRVKMAHQDGVDLVACDALGGQARIGGDPTVDHQVAVRFAHQECGLAPTSSSERVAGSDEVKFDHESSPSGKNRPCANTPLLSRASAGTRK